MAGKPEFENKVSDEKSEALIKLLLEITVNNFNETLN